MKRIKNLWSKEETIWSFALYSTAVGAGTLFLPIQLGSTGVVVLLITTLMAYPITYWPHKALCQFILASNNKSKEGITGAVNYYYGYKIGNLITILYFLAFLVVILIYAVTINNSLIEQLEKFIRVNNAVRILLSLIIIVVLNTIFLMGRNITIKVMSFLVFPILGYFLFLSIYLIKNWHLTFLAIRLSSFNYHLLNQIWTSIPVVVFAFSHTPIISTFAIDQQEKYGSKAMNKCKRIMKVTYLLICISVLFFVFSCLLSIPHSCILNAKRNNITILSTLSMMPSSPVWFSVLGNIMAIIVMVKSFLGTYFGVIEGSVKIVKLTLNKVGIYKNFIFNRMISIIIVSIVTFIACYLNPNVISMIYIISGPLIAMILFIMPTVSAWIIPILKPYRSKENLLVLIIGILCILVMIIN